MRLVLILAALLLPLLMPLLSKTSSLKDFFVASERLGWILGGLAGTAAGLSAFVFVGGPAMFSRLGLESAWILVPAPFTAALQCWLIGEPVMRIRKNLQTGELITLPQLIELSYGGRTPRLVAAALLLLGVVAMMAVQVRGTAALLEPAMGSASWVASAWVVGCSCLVAAAGGMRTGALLEAGQALLMAAAAVTVSVAALGSAGGLKTALEALLQAGKLKPFGTLGEEVALGWVLLFSIGTCAQPHYVQKFLMIRGRRELRWLPLAATLPLVITVTVWLSMGAASVALAGEATSWEQADKVTGSLLFGALPIWCSGLVIVGAVSAISSTTVSLATMAAAALAVDIPAAAGVITPARNLSWARLATLLVGGSSILLGILWKRGIGYLGIFGWGSFTATFLPVLLFGLNIKRGRPTAAATAMAAGCATQLLLAAAKASVPDPGLAGAAVGIATLGLFELPAFLKGRKVRRR